MKHLPSSTKAACPLSIRRHAKQLHIGCCTCLVLFFTRGFWDVALIKHFNPYLLERISSRSRPKLPFDELLEELSYHELLEEASINELLFHPMKSFQ